MAERLIGLQALYNVDRDEFNAFCEKQNKYIKYYNQYGSIKYLINTLIVELFVADIIKNYNPFYYVKHNDPNYDLYYGDEVGVYSDEPDLTLIDLRSGDECTIEVKHFYDKASYDKTINIYQLWFETHNEKLIKINFGDNAYIADHNADCMMFVLINNDNIYTTYMNNEGKIIKNKSKCYQNDLNLILITDEDKRK